MVLCFGGKVNKTFSTGFFPRHSVCLSVKLITSHIGYYFYLSTNGIPMHNTYDIIFLDIERIFLEQTRCVCETLMPPTRPFFEISNLDIQT